jgi:hypothetical protein
VIWKVIFKSLSNVHTVQNRLLIHTNYELNLSLFAAKEESVKIEPDDSTSHFAFDENLENGVTSAAQSQTSFNFAHDFRIDKMNETLPTELSLKCPESFECKPHLKSHLESHRCAS